MDGQLAAPFHFAAEFLILAVCAGAAADALRGLKDGAGWRAWTRATGFASLVAAQVAHGALVVEGDGEISIVVLRAVGFGLLALSMRPMPAAGMPALFFAGSDARWAALPGFFSLVAAARLLSGRREDREPSTFFLAGAFVLFAAGEGLLVAADPEGGVLLAISHAVRGVGALLLARYLWTSFARSVRLRFVAVFVAALVLLATVVAGALTQVIGSNLEESELTRLADVARGQNNAIGDRRDQIIQQTSLMARELPDSFGRLSAASARNFFEQGGAVLLPPSADVLAFTDAKGRVISAAREIPASSTTSRSIVDLSRIEQIAITGSSVVQRSLARQPAADLVSIELTKIAAVGAAPVLGTGAKLLGVIVVGVDLDRAFLRALRVGAEADITVLKAGQVVSTTYQNPRTSVEDKAAAGGLVSGELRAAVRRTVEEQGQIYSAISSPGGERSFTVFAPLTSSDESQVVGVVAVSRPAVLLADAQRTINRTLFLITLAASAIAAVFAWFLSGRVTRPIRALTRAARQVRGGDLDVRATVDLPDEVGTLGEAFNEMAHSLKRMTDDLRGAADEEANLRARMEAIMQSMGDALVATDTGGTVVAFNRAAESMMARRADDAVGRRLGEVLKGSDPNGRALADAALGGNGIGIIATVEATDGRRVPVAVTGAPLRDAAGETVGRVIVLRDTSREHEAERMKSEFLANVSHELRTPLTPIKGYTEILRRKQFPRQKAQTFLDGIMESTKRLERIVEILVDFAAMEAGRLKPHLEPIDLRAFLGGVVDTWKDRTPRHRFVRKVPANLPAVLGDERLLKKCLEELLDNAVKFSPDGGDIEIEAEPATAGNRRTRPVGVRILIRDRGIGIEESKMGTLFQDFRQGDGSETRPFGGLGLGLSYARRVVLAHRGQITATSEPGRGSTFAVTLPIAPAAVRSLRPSGSAGKPAGTKKPAGRRPKIMPRKTTAASSGTVIRKKVAAAKMPPRRKHLR